MEMALEMPENDVIFVTYVAKLCMMFKYIKLEENKLIHYTVCFDMRLFALKS